MRSWRSRVGPLVALALALALAACGEDREGSVDESGGSTATTGTGTTGTGTTTTPAAAGPAVATVAMRATEFAFDPRNPRVSKPGVVTFRVRNAGNAPHALEVEGPGGEVETDTIEPGRSATLKANLSRPGSYVLYCPVGDHESRGMKGRVTVAGGGGSSAGSTRTSTGEDSGTTTGEDSGNGGSGGGY